MVRQFDDISRAIGNVEGQITSLTKDVRDLKESVETIVRSMGNLPPSPQCLENHNQLTTEVNSLKVKGARHLGFVSGIAITGSMIVQWLLSQIGVKLQ